MKIRELVKDLSCHFNTICGEKICADADIQGLLDTEITGIASDSRKVLPGSLFFCIVGANSDGHDYAAMAMEKGAAALVVQKDIDLSAAAGAGADNLKEQPAIIRVEDSRFAMAAISAAFYGHPAREMKIIGVTGTKGKTTTTYMVRSILEARSCGNH